MTIELTIRELVPAEFGLVWPVFHAVVAAGDTYAFDPATTIDAARRLMTTPPARTFVATRGDTVVGCYLLRPAQGGLGDHVANAGYMVAPEARRQGIAQRLCEHSLVVAREAGFLAMQFSFVVATNETAVRLWQRCGFAIVGRVPAAFRHARLGLVDILIMHRFLDGVAPEELANRVGNG